LTATLAPSSRNAVVTALPKPPVPPATRTTLPPNLALTNTPRNKPQSSRTINGLDAHFARFLLDEGHGPPAKTAAAISGDYVQFIEEGVVAVERKTEAPGQNDIAEESWAVVDQPDAPEGGKRKKLMKSGPCAADSSKCMAPGSCSASARIMGKSTTSSPGMASRNSSDGTFTPRSARAVWRRGRSSRFDGWPQGRRRCRRGSIHRTESDRANRDRSGRFRFPQRRAGGPCGRAGKCGPNGEKFPQRPARGRIPGSSAWGIRF